MLGPTLALLLLATRPQDPLEQWPQWRGPLANGIAPQADPPVEWSETKNVRWKVELPGSGSATPIVWGDRLFVLAAVRTDRKGEARAPAPADPGGRRMSTGPPDVLYRFEVLCLDRSTGRELWRRTAIEQQPHEGHHPTHGYASASPVTDGKILVASFGSRGLFAFDLDGKELWKRDLGDMRIKVGFGEGISPVLHEDAVVVNWDHEGDSFIVRLDARTGEERWRQARDEKSTWSTPLIARHGGRAQVIVNASRVRSYDLETGRLAWECGGQTQNAISMPVTADGTVFCTTGFRGFAVEAIGLDSKGDVTGRTPWRRSDVGSYVASPLLYGDSLYLTKERNGILLCLDPKTGKERYPETRLPGIDVIYASLAGAAGRIYIAGREGRTVVLKHGPAFEVLATNHLSEGADASPVLVGRQLFLRGTKHLYCIENR
jgi:outer membrane protein assembly factor BamB